MVEHDPTPRVCEHPERIGGSDDWAEAAAQADVMQYRLPRPHPDTVPASVTAAVITITGLAASGTSPKQVTGFQGVREGPTADELGTVATLDDAVGAFDPTEGSSGRPPSAFVCERRTTNVPAKTHS